MFDAIHGLVRNRARLFEQGRVLNPWCQVCPRVVSLQLPRSTLDHLFCVLVREAWLYIRDLVVRNQPELQGEEDCSLVRFLFPRDRMDGEVSWIMANYLDIVQEQCIARGTTLLQPAVRGRLADRLRAARPGRSGA